MTFVKTNSVSETEEIGRQIANKVADKTHVFIALCGEMGVGKTAFTRGFCRALGVSNVKSPTYTIVNEYKGDKTIFHFDMYRIMSSDDLYSIDYDGYLDREGIILCEWSENIKEDIPEDAIWISISRTDDSESSRKIAIEGVSL